MRKTATLSTMTALSFGLLLVGCASTYQPIVDMKGVDNARYQQDLSECRQYAGQVDVAEDTATDTLIGAGIGAALGAAVGAIGGDPGTGAAIGATAGGIGGGASGGMSSAQRQKSIINNCLAGRGYRVL